MKTTKVANYSVNTLDSLPSTWAIVVVPGIFGSRLINPISGRSLKSKSFWNPDSRGWKLNTGASTSARTIAKRMNVYKTRVRPRWENADKKYPKEEGTTRLRRGFGSVAWSFYGAGIKALEKEFEDKKAQVFVFGYDFRQDNWINGGRLLKFIYYTVHGEFGIKFKPIVVTHSMGGLVTRAACCRFFDMNDGKAADTTTNLKGEDMIAGVVHTLMPTYGTPKGYSAWRTGWGGQLGGIVGNNAADFSNRCHATPSLYQLAPTQLYAFPPPATPNQGAGNDDQYWLAFDQEVFDKSESSSKKEDRLEQRIENSLNLIRNDQQKRDQVVGRSEKAVEEVRAALEAYNKDKTTYAFAKLRKALIGYPYLLYSDTSGWLGIPDRKYMKKDANKAKAAKKCIDLAEQFHAGRVGDYMHPKTWVLHSTQNKGTIVGVTVSRVAPWKDKLRDKLQESGLRTECKVENKLGTRGDGTVTDLSAAAYDGRDKLQPLDDEKDDNKCDQVKGVVHDQAFEHYKGVEKLVELVRAAHNQLSKDGFGSWKGKNEKYLAPKEWVNKYKSVKYTVSVVWTGSDRKVKMKALMDNQGQQQDGIDLSKRKEISKLLRA